MKNELPMLVKAKREEGSEEEANGATQSKEEAVFKFEASYIRVCLRTVLFCWDGSKRQPLEKWAPEIRAGPPRAREGTAPRCHPKGHIAECR